MIPQSTFMICAEIMEDRIESLRTLLAGMNMEPGLVDPQNKLIPFSQFRQLHVARLVIIELQTGDDIKSYDVKPRPWPATLVLLGDCDGPGENFIAELAVRADPGLRKIFSHCRDFDADSEILYQWMIKRNKKPAANYINWVGRTVEQIHEEATLHEKLSKKLKSLVTEEYPRTAEQIHQALLEFVDDELKNRRLTLTEIPKTPFLWWLGNLIHKISVPVLLLIFSPLLLLLSPLIVFRLRDLERSDPEIMPRPDPEHIASLAQSEDRLVTNQFSAFGDVKPGMFRKSLILFFLYLLDYSARHVYNRGFLTRVKTIHFARWVLLDNQNRLLFASNYDGDLESYMDDFINKVGWGLNLVFSNGVGWPRTRWLIKEGAEHEQRFKYFLRRHQYHTDVWYKAYPDLTTVDLARNSRIRQGLKYSGFKNELEAQQWLSLI